MQELTPMRFLLKVKKEESLTSENKEISKEEIAKIFQEVMKTISLCPLTSTIFHTRQTLKTLKDESKVFWVSEAH